MTKREKEAEKIQNLEHQLKRALADYSNYQKRVESEKETIVNFAKAILVAKFLPVLDSFEKAEKAIQDHSEGVKEGLAMAVSHFRKILQEEGVEEIDTTGSFDPMEHEAVETVEGEDNKILEVVEKGYKLEGKVLRPAKVKVGRKQL